VWFGVCVGWGGGGGGGGGGGACGGGGGGGSETDLQILQMSQADIFADAAGRVIGSKCLERSKVGGEAVTLCNGIVRDYARVRVGKMRRTRLSGP